MFPSHDRIGGEFLPQPDHFHSDGMDAFRYGVTPFRVRYERQEAENNAAEDYAYELEVENGLRNLLFNCLMMRGLLECMYHVAKRKTILQV